MNPEMQTKAAILYQLNEPLEIETLQMPRLEAGQVLVKIAYSGLCGTQLLEIQGKKGIDRYLPHALGHEASGTVVEIGPGVTRLKPSDRVVLSWIKGPGLDAKGPGYRTARDGAVVNAGSIATFSELAIVAENRCTVIPPEFSLDAAALLGCAVPTGAGIVLNQMRANGSDSLVIFGAGGIGLSALLAAASLNCFPIVVVDISHDKLEFAKSLGATDVVSALSPSALEEIQSITRGGADFCLEASGAAPAMELAFQATRRHGGRCILAGNLCHGSTIAIDPFELIMGKCVEGTVGGNANMPRDIASYLRLNRKGSFPFERLISNIYGLDTINQGFESLKKGLLGRALIQMET